MHAQINPSLLPFTGSVLRYIMLKIAIICPKFAGMCIHIYLSLPSCCSRGPWLVHLVCRSRRGQMRCAVLTAGYDTEISAFMRIDNLPCPNKRSSFKCASGLPPRIVMGLLIHTDSSDACRASIPSSRLQESVGLATTLHTFDFERVQRTTINAVTQI